MGTVFVTGASGKIGLPLVRALVQAGHEVRGLSRADAGLEAIAAAGARPVRGALADPAALAEGLDQASWVFHLAGGVRGAGRATADLVNRVGTQHLMTRLDTLPADQLQAVVFASTVAVYGDRSGLWVSEDMPTRPMTQYGLSKVEAEQILLGGHSSRGLPVRIARLSAVYGADFPFLMVDRIRSGRAWLPGEGRNIVPTIHVDDAVAGLLAIAERGEDGGIYNLADPHPVSVREFYGLVHARVGGTPVRFWSTWIPSYVQFAAARASERIDARLGRFPRFTPDNLRLFTASVRQKVDRMDKELNFEWRHPTCRAGLDATLGANA